MVKSGLEPGTSGSTVQSSNHYTTAAHTKLGGRTLECFYLFASLSIKNKIPKYADDVSLLTPQHTDSSAEDEFRHVVDWSSENKLVINVKKTKEIIFWRSNKCANKYDIPEIPGIERVDQAKLLGVILTSTLSWSAHVDFLLPTATQRFYLLDQLSLIRSA